MPSFFFTPDELALLDSLAHDPGLEPQFELLRATLIWQDEMPPAMPHALAKKLALLWLARRFLHEGKDLREHDAPYDLEAIWLEAWRGAPRWPGFRRVVLSRRDRATLEACLRDMEAGLP